MIFRWKGQCRNMIRTNPVSLKSTMLYTKLQGSFFSVLEKKVLKASLLYIGMVAINRLELYEQTFLAPTQEG